MVDSVQGLRQGDYLPAVKYLYVVDGDNPTAVEIPTPLGVVVVTQCCDLARPDSGNIPLAAAVVQLQGDAARQAASGRMPRYTTIDHLPPDNFVDLGQTGSISFNNALRTERRGCTSTDDRLHFQSRIVRRFGRFAYPDEAQPFMKKIQDRLRSKAGSPNSSLGQCIDRIETIRVEADWDSGPPWTVTVVLILKEGELATEAEPIPRQQLAEGLSVSEAANRVASFRPGMAGINESWESLGDALVLDALRDTSASANIGEAVAEVVQESDFTYYRYRRSADLDVDDLSDDA